MTRVSALPRTHKQIVAALLDGFEVFAEYNFTSGVRGGNAGGWIIGARDDGNRRAPIFDRHAANAMLALELRGIVDRTDGLLTLVRGTIEDDRGA